MHRLTVLILVAVVSTTHLAAQGRLCFSPAPGPACSAFTLTTFGGYVVLGSDQTGDTPFREVADWGLMANVGPRDAIGVSMFASADRLGLAVGPAVHYRRWLSSDASFEVAVGTPLVSSGDKVRAGSVFGLVKWSPSRWFALAARPEIISQTVYSCGPTTCGAVAGARARISLGAETSGVPGLVLSLVGGAATFVVALIALGPAGD